MEENTKNKWFWGQWGTGNGQYAYCPRCKEKVSVRIVDGKSYCKRCNTEVEWRDRK